MRVAYKALSGWAGVAFAFFLSGCGTERVAGNSGAGNPPSAPVTATFTMKTASGSAALAKTSVDSGSGNGPTFVDAGGMPFTINEARCIIGRVDIHLPSGAACPEDAEEHCEGSKIQLPGPFRMDLLTGSSIPSFDSILIPAGIYQRVDVRLEDAEMGLPVDPAWDSLIGHSMVIKGTFAYQGRSNRKFSFLLEFNEDVRFENPQGFTLDGKKPLYEIAVKLNVQEWLRHIDIARCLDDGEVALDEAGNLLIDEENGCGGLEDSLEEAIKGSGKFEEDEEESGSRESGEDRG